MAGSMTDPTKWAGNWGAGVGRSGTKWSANYVAAGPAIFQKAAASVTTWQSQVASAQAASAFVKGLNAVNFTQVTAVVNGAGQSKYTTSGTTKQAGYATFANVAGSKWPAILSSLPPRGPRGSAENQTRMAQWSAQLIATRGSY